MSVITEAQAVVARAKDDYARQLAAVDGLLDVAVATDPTTLVAAQAIQGTYASGILTPARLSATAIGVAVYERLASRDFMRCIR